MLFYHATNMDNLGSIMTEGIKANNMEGLVYLTKTPSDSAKFLLIRGIKNIVSLAIELDPSELEESFDHNYNFFKCRCYSYNKDIPVDKINLDKSIKYE